MPKEGKLHLIKCAPPPSHLPIYQRVDPREVSFFGRTNYEAALEEKKFIFGIKRLDRARHLYAIGKSGIGKSKFLETLIRQDIVYGHGLCLFDPRGDIISAVLDFIPEERVCDVIVIDPLDNEFLVAFNPFVNVPRESRYQVAEGFAALMAKRCGSHWNPEVDHVLRFAVLALLDYPEATLPGVVLMLTDAGYRERVVGHILNEVVKRFWAQEFVSRDHHAITILVDTLSQYAANPFLKTFFVQQKNTIDFTQCIRERKIVLVNCAQGKLGREHAAFLGGLFMIKLREAMMARVEAQDTFYVYIDELSLLATDTFDQFFAEAGTYGIALTLTQQYPEELSERLRTVLLGNAGTLVIFRVSGDDALRLEKEMAPVFQAKDMMNLGVREFYIKMMIDGEIYDPFSGEVLKLFPLEVPSLRERIINATRRIYATPRGSQNYML